MVLARSKVMKSYVLLVLAIFVNLATSTWCHKSFAKEGFSTDVREAPSAVKKAWDSTFALITMSPKLHNGTAFLIFKTLEGDKLALYFLTADHNITMCDKNRLCPSTSLIQNARLQERATYVDVDTLNGVRFDNVEYNAELTDAKMALLKVTVPKDMEGLPNPIELPKDCNIQVGSTLYGVGWPWTPSRTDPSRLSIADANQVVKRWSQGIFLGYLNFTDEKQAQFASTVDSISGSSGGPIVTADGVVVSLINKAKSNPGNSYAGDEASDKMAYQTLGPRCAFFKSIRESLGL
ncbi:MAG: S1 family peptidase [Bdellovibrionales bacterium]